MQLLKFLTLCVVMLLLQQIQAGQGQASVELLEPVQPPVSAQPQQILFLNTYSVGLPVPDSIDRGFVTGLREGGGSVKDVFIEHLDLAREPSSEYRAIKGEFLRHKLADKHVGIVIAEGLPAVDFWATEVKRLFPDAPLVALIVPDVNLLHNYSNKVVMIPWQIQASETLRLALDLFPKTRRVVVVTGARDNILPFLHETQKAFAPWSDTLDFEYTNEMTYEQMLHHISALPPDSIIIYSSYFSDTTDRSFVPVEVAVKVCNLASVPVFSTQEVFLGKGIVGGSLLKTEMTGQQVAKIALDYLSGRLKLDKPVTTFDTHSQKMFDWNELIRWGADISALPKDSIIINRPRTLWSQYKKEVIASTVFSLILSSLVLTLWMLNRRLKRLTIAVSDSEAHYHSLFDNSLIGVTLTDKSLVIVEANDAFCTMLEYSRGELIGKKTISDITHPDDTVTCMDMVNKLMRHEIDHYSREKNYISKTGKTIPVLIYIRGRFSPDGEYEGTISSVLDITERKKADDLLRENEEKYRTLFNNSEIAMFRSKLDGSETLEANQKFLDLIGKTREETIGKPSEILWVDPKEREEMVRRLVAEGSVSEYAYRMLTREKGVRNCITSLRLYRDQSILEGSIVDFTEMKRAEEALRQSQNFVNNILETTPNLIYIYDLQESRNVYSNSAMPCIIGYTSEEILEQGEQLFANIMHPEDFAVVDAHHERLASALDNRVQEVEYRMRHAKGHWVVLRSKDKPYLRDDQGKVKQILGVAEDVTELKLATELLESQFENSPDIILIIDRNFKIETINKIVTGNFSVENIKGMDSISLLPPEHQDLVRENINKCFETGSIQEFEHSIGDGRWVRARVVPMITDSEISRVMIISTNITKQRQAEMERIEYARRLELATASGKLAVWDWNVKDNSMLWDDQMFELYGISRDVFPSNIDAWTNGLHPDDKQRAFDECTAALEGVKEFNTTFRVLHPDGTVKHLKANAIVIKDQSGNAIRMIGINTDITEQIQAEEERQKLEAHLLQAQKMEAIGTLAGGIAHDFNNILGAILGYAELIQEDSPAGSMVRKDIDQVVKASHRAKDLVKQILAFSRQAATDHISLQPGVIIKEALKMLRASLPSTIAIQQDIDPEAGLILADPTQIHQVMVNLCTNAFHAMEVTGGTLTISLKKKTLSQNDLANEPRVQPGDFVQLSIGDTGPGIAPEIQEKMFDPYFTTKEVGKGTGMGLAIIHGIAKTYEGFVTCHSQLGEGTVFEVYLPVIADPTLHEIETAPLDLTQLGNERILFIDDEEILAEMGQTMLERLGYRVTVRKSSIEALTTFQNQPDKFDLVITDQTMPGMTGSDLARRMLQIRPGIPIILCTGYSALISEEKAKHFGIKGFAMKPLTKKDIAELIRQVLDGGNVLP